MAGNAPNGGRGGCGSCGGPAPRAGLVGFVGIDLRMVADPLGRLRVCRPLPIETARVRASASKTQGGTTMGPLPSGDEDVRPATAWKIHLSRPAGRCDGRIAALAEPISTSSDYSIWRLDPPARARAYYQDRIGRPASPKIDDALSLRCMRRCGRGNPMTPG